MNTLHWILQFFMGLGLGVAAASAIALIVARMLLDK